MLASVLAACQEGEPLAITDGAGESLCVTVPARADSGAVLDEGDRDAGGPELRVDCDSDPTNEPLAVSRSAEMSRAGDDDPALYLPALLTALPAANTERGSTVNSRDTDAARAFGGDQGAAVEPAVQRFFEPDASAKGPVVVLKLDDLRSTPSVRRKFEQVADLAGRKRINVSFGVIAEGWADNGKKQELYAWTRAMAARGYVELWHHGFSHTRAGDASSWWEYKNRCLADQAESLIRAASLLKDTCGVTFRSFGAPYNSNDAVTLRAMKALPEIKVWMFPSPASQEQYFSLNERIDLDPGHRLDESHFRARFDAAPAKSYVVVQGHPAVWDDTDMVTFEGIIDYLLSKGARFLAPYQYYLQKRAAARTLHRVIESPAQETR